MSEAARSYRLKAMMYRFFCLHEHQKHTFDELRAMLSDSDFEWHNSSESLVGVDAYRTEFNQFVGERRCSHNPDFMNVEFIGNGQATLAFNLGYQIIQGKIMELNVIEHYDVLVSDLDDEPVPHIIKCTITRISDLEGGKFDDLYQQNHSAFLAHLETSGSLAKDAIT